MESDIIKAIELLKSGKVGKVSKNIFTVANAVVFRDVKDSHHGAYKVQEIIAIKTNSGVILGNSSRMAQLEDQRYKTIIQPARIQRILSEMITMIPFSVFNEAGLDILTCEIVDSGEAETLKEWKHSYSARMDQETIERHFTGARLFKAMPKGILKKDYTTRAFSANAKYFLCDVDRGEIQHNIINFFLAELPEKCGTIEEAYLMLKPDEVKTAEKNGLVVPRQGEFFFVPLDELSAARALNVLPDDKDEIREIRVGNSRPNRVERGYKIGELFLVSGTISHTGREHKDLELPKSQWFKVVPNTSKANFQLTGDID